MSEITIKTKLTPAEKFATLGGITAFGVLVSLLIGKNLLLQTLLTAFILFLMNGRRPSITFALIMKFNRDMLAARRFISMAIMLRKWENKRDSVASVFERNAKLYPNKDAFLIDDTKITFKEIDNFSNKVGRFFKSRGYLKGETISLFMETRLEYAPMWLGLSKVGIITALINTNLRKETLIHSICTSSTKAVIVSTELLEALKEIIDDEEISKMEIFIYDNQTTDLKMISEKNVNLHRELEKTSSESLDISDVKSKDKLFFIYTSGTTGMPKAAVITHLRFMFMSSGVFKMFGVGSDDVIYNTLPLYHTAGGMLGAGIVLLFGCTMALRKKFSASNFWSDCIKYNCTVAQYIGELCRFLLLTPARPEDTKHKVKLMFGNGLRPQIWTQFQERFRIKQLGEAYGATESNTNLANFDNTVGAVGFVPQFGKFLYPVDLIKCDEETGEPIRDEDGFCMRCDYGEPGVFIGKISPNHPARNFSGYSDKKASEKKILRNVFKQGDSYFNSSDILVMDLYGYFYFKDRTGDTYRWRGENVATSEVEGIIMRIAGLSDCVVYGVEIPNTEGKAGMAALVDPDSQIDMETLAKGIRNGLPIYARPIFIRIMPQLPMTGTFKLKKRDLQLEGYDISKITDPIYLLQSDGSYKVMTVEKNNEIKEGRAKL